MNDVPRPRTVDELAALPVGPAFGLSVTLVNGTMERRPIAPAMIAYYSNDTDIISWVDREGSWTLGRYADGSWFRQRK